MDAIGSIIPKVKYGHPIEAHMPIGTYDLEYSDLTSLSRTEKNSGNLSAVRKDLYHAMVILYEKTPYCSMVHPIRRGRHSSQ